MKNIIEVDNCEGFLISKDNIIIEINKDFLDLTGYPESQLVGKTLAEVSKILRIDSQMNLQDMKDLHSLYIFNNEGLAIDVTITCELSSKENTKIYYVQENLQTLLRNMLLNFDDLNISGKQALAIYSYPDFICLQTNEKYTNSLNLINITSDNPLGKPYPYPKYTLKVMEEGSFYEDEVKFIGSDGIATYWNMSMKLIPGDENKTYLLLSLYDLNNKVNEKKSHDKKRIEMELILENISDVITIVNNKGEFIYVNQAGIDKLSSYTTDVESLDDKVQFEFFTYHDIDGNELSYEDTPIQRVLRGEHINKEIIAGTSHLPTTYHECIGIPIYNNLGNIDIGILTYRDIGDRIKAEEAMLWRMKQEN